VLPRDTGIAQELITRGLSNLRPAAVDALLALPQKQRLCILRRGFGSHAQIKSLLQEHYNYIDSAEYMRRCTACGRMVL